MRLWSVIVETQQRFSIKELLERYNLQEKKTIYRWRKVAGIKEFSKDDRGRVAATLEEVEKLDKVAEHVKKPRANLSDFIPSLPTEVVKAVVPQAEFLELPSNPDFASVVKAIERIAKAIEGNKSLDSYKWLEVASDRGWLLATSEVKKLVGVSPSTRKNSDFFSRGSWRFTKAGKIGRETAWRVEKVEIPDLEIKSGKVK